MFLRLLEREEAFFGKRESVVYDRASILYTLDRLQIENDEVLLQKKSHFHEKVWKFDYWKPELFFSGGEGKVYFITTK